MSDRLLKRKSYVFILRGTKVLVFMEPEIEPDIDCIPGGTLDPGEAEEDAAYREVAEETGRDDLKIDHFLGRNIFDYDEGMVPERHQQSFFVGHFLGNCPNEWNHYENTPSEGGPPILLAYRWVDLSGELTSLHDKYRGFLDELRSYAFERGVDAR